MGRRMAWRAAASVLGLSENALYTYIRHGVVPAMRIGEPGRHGRLVVDIDLCEQALKDEMMKNLRTPEIEQPYSPIRKVK